MQIRRTGNSCSLNQKNVCYLFLPFGVVARMFNFFFAEKLFSENDFDDFLKFFWTIFGLNDNPPEKNSLFSALYLSLITLLLLRCLNCQKTLVSGQIQDGDFKEVYISTLGGNSQRNLVDRIIFAKNFCRKIVLKKFLLRILAKNLVRSFSSKSFSARNTKKRPQHNRCEANVSRSSR